MFMEDRIFANTRGGVISMVGGALVIMLLCFSKKIYNLNICRKNQYQLILIKKLFADSHIATTLPKVKLYLNALQKILLKQIKCMRMKQAIILKSKAMLDVLLK